MLIINFFFFFQVPGNDSKIRSYVDIYNFFIKNDLDLQLLNSKLFNKVMNLEFPNQCQFNDEILKISLKIEETNRQTLRKLPVLFINFFDYEDCLKGIVSVMGCNMSTVYVADILLHRVEDESSFKLRGKNILKELHTRFERKYGLDVDFIIINHDFLSEIETNDVPFDILPCASLISDAILNCSLDWTDCVTPAQVNEEKNHIANIFQIVQDIHKDRDMILGQVVLAYIDRVFPLINNLTTTNARLLANLLQGKLLTSPAIMAAFLDPQIFNNIYKNNVPEIKLDVALFGYVTLRSEKHDFLLNQFAKYKQKRDHFSAISYDLEKKKFWQLIAQNEEYEEMAQWAGTMLVLPAYVPKIDEKKWFQNFKNFAGTDEQLLLRKFLYFIDL